MIRTLKSLVLGQQSGLESRWGWGWGTGEGAALGDSCFKAIGTLEYIALFSAPRLTEAGRAGPPPKLPGAAQFLELTSGREALRS